MNLTLSDIQQAFLQVQKQLSPTPLLRCGALEKELNFNGKIFIKCECDQPTGSFKVRGAFNVLSTLSPQQRERGVVARSSGNFAQAVAFAAEKMHIAATIIMPQNAPKVKLEGTKKFGPTIIIAGNTHEEGDLIVKEQVEKNGLVPIHPYNDYRTMAGQGTAALEILEQQPDINHFFCPIGGGGLMSGCAAALKLTNEAITTHGIEPAGAADYYASRQSGKKERWESINTIADGLRAPSVGKLNYPILNRYVDKVSIVTDEEIKKAMKWIYEKCQIITEPSGVVSLAGFTKEHSQISGNIVILISGKNVDPENFNNWIAEKS